MKSICAFALDFALSILVISPAHAEEGSGVILVLDASGSMRQR